MINILYLLISSEAICYIGTDLVYDMHKFQFSEILGSLKMLNKIGPSI